MTSEPPNEWEMREFLKRALYPGEHVVWKERCWSRLRKQRGATPAYVWAWLVIAAMVVGLAVGAVRLAQSTGFNAAYLLLLLAIPIGRLILRQAVDSPMYCRSRTMYAVTDQRVMIVRDCNRGVPVQSLPLRFVQMVQAKTDRADGAGSVRFGWWDAAADDWQFPVSFFMVPAPERVARIVEDEVERRNGQLRG